jgi:hypothetical protein
MYAAVRPWQEEWQEGCIDVSDADCAWLCSRPESIKNLILRFPPSCLVRGKVDLLCPARGSVGIVTSYFEPSEEYPYGTVSVRPGPEADKRFACDPDWLEVVGYWRGLSHERIKAILG